MFYATHANFRWSHKPCLFRVNIRIDQEKGSQGRICNPLALYFLIYSSAESLAPDGAINKQDYRFLLCYGIIVDCNSLPNRHVDAFFHRHISHKRCEQGVNPALWVVGTEGAGDGAKHAELNVPFCFRVYTIIPPPTGIPFFSRMNLPISGM